ncbi:hypothetical protein WG66_004112 [Moniliophthora roreri]|uniref:F-box domain-containing protein n=1 Tax=Moniliophthora roreri TaxID=221103 RepID=A0A0W0ETJ2_MONRR|nr:hypothetical protein WG66_004112 [Moniliophthora roreri]
MLDTPIIQHKSLSKSLSVSRSSAMKRLFRNTISSADRHIITQYLRDAEKDVKDCQAEISRLKMAIITLESRRDGLRKSMDRYRSLLSPVHRLPAEILLNVFTFCCEQNELCLEQKDSTRPCAPPPAVAISMVCGRWRDVALASPSLWTSICIEFSNWKSDHHKLLRMTRLFLERSQKAPLKLELDFSHTEGNIEPVLDTLSLLVQHSNRWFDLELRVMTSIIRHPVFTQIRGRLPLLKWLYFNEVPIPDSAPEPVDDWIDRLNILEFAPNLSHLAFKPDFHVVDFLLPLEQIRTLKLHDSYAINSLEFLPLCSNVQRLELFRVGGGEAYTGPMVTCSNIQNLVIEAESQDDVSCILRHSNFPQLTSILISGLKSGISEDWVRWDDLEVPIETFLRRSACTITTLHLQSLPMLDHQAISLLRLMPALENLHIQEMVRDNEEFPINKIVTSVFLQNLLVDHACSSESTPFLPRLANLTLAVHGYNLDGEALLKAITSRWLATRGLPSDVGVNSLKSVSIRLIGEACHIENDLFALDGFRDAGLRVSVSYSFVG